MNTDPPSPEPDDALETRLRQHLQTEYLDDDGFTRRALEAIPARAPQTRRQVLLGTAALVGLAIAAATSGGAVPEVRSAVANLPWPDLAVSPQALVAVLWSLNLAVVFAMPTWILLRRRRTG